MWMVLGVIFTLILILFLVVLFSHITIHFVFTYNDNQKDIIITFIWMKLIKFTRTIPVTDFDYSNMTLESLKNDETMGYENENKKSEDIKQREKAQAILTTMKDVIPDIKKLLKSIRLKNLEWNTSFGLKYADHTALMTGLLYSFKGFIVSFVMNSVQNFTTPSVNVQPLFNQKKYETKVQCILSFRIGQIMRNMLKILNKLGKNEKGGSK
ncbi:DUF2953 domain-containing protein [Bacillaceae bacterium W0354]